MQPLSRKPFEFGRQFENEPFGQPMSSIGYRAPSMSVPGLVGGQAVDSWRNMGPRPSQPYGGAAVSQPIEARGYGGYGAADRAAGGTWDGGEVGRERAGRSGGQEDGQGGRMDNYGRGNYGGPQNCTSISSTPSEVSLS